MPKTIRIKVDETKKFVKKHPILISCTATAVVTHKMTRTAVQRSASEIMYEAGRIAGLRDVQLAACLHFIESKELWDEFLEFIPKIEV